MCARNVLSIVDTIINVNHHWYNISHIILHTNFVVAIHNLIPSVSFSACLLAWTADAGGRLWTPTSLADLSFATTGVSTGLRDQIASSTSIKSGHPRNSLGV